MNAKEHNRLLIWLAVAFLGGMALMAVILLSTRGAPTSTPTQAGTLLFD